MRHESTQAYLPVLLQIAHVGPARHATYGILALALALRAVIAVGQERAHGVGLKARIELAIGDESRQAYRPQPHAARRAAKEAIFLG